MSELKKCFSDETRKRMSESAKLRCNDEWRKRRSEALATPLNTDIVKKLYECGCTQDEIAEVMGVSQKVIWRHMKNHGIPVRVAKKRNQFGEKNSSWKGGKAKYQAFHLRVESKYGKAKEYPCSVCGTTDENLSYDWANLTGKYEDIEDYAPMSRSCHTKYDKMRKRWWLECRKKTD